MPRSRRVTAISASVMVSQVFAGIFEEILIGAGCKYGLIWNVIKIYKIVERTKKSGQTDWDYTMLIASPSSQSVNPVINKNLGYVPGRDFTGAAAARAQAADGQGRHRRGGLEVAGGLCRVYAREREALAAARARYRGEGGLEDEAGNVCCCRPKIDLVKSAPARTPEGVLGAV